MCKKMLQQTYVLFYYYLRTYINPLETELIKFMTVYLTKTQPMLRFSKEIGYSTFRIKENLVECLL
jgi:hypothetical protein